MFFEIQSAFLKSWLQFAETSTKAMTDTAMEMGRVSANTWSGALGGPQVANPLFPFSFSGIPTAFPGYSANFFQPVFNPAALATMWLRPFQPPAPISMFPGSWPMMSPWMGMMGMARPFSAQPVPTIVDIMASSYRTAGGHAAAAVITAPFQSYDNPALWWTKPAGRGWLN